LTNEIFARGKLYMDGLALGDEASINILINLRVKLDDISYKANKENCISCGKILIIAIANPSMYNFPLANISFVRSSLLS
jgi:hypothetical protein